MNGNEQFAIGDKVRSKKTGFVGTISKLIIDKESTYVIARENPALFAGFARIYIGDLEHVAADPAPAESSITETVILGQDKPTKPIGGTTFVIDFKVSDEGKALLDQLQLAAENAKAVGLTSGSTEPKGLSSDDKLAIKEVLLDAARGGHLTKMMAYELIEQFRQVDAA